MVTKLLLFDQRDYIFAIWIDLQYNNFMCDVSFMTTRLQQCTKLAICRVLSLNFIYSLPIFFKISTGESFDCPSDSEWTMLNMGK